MVDDRIPDDDQGDGFEGRPRPRLIARADSDPDYYEPSLGDATSSDRDYERPEVDDSWTLRAGELADWALARVFNRTDRYITYRLNGDKPEHVTLPLSGPVEGALSRDIVVRHFTATRPGEVLVAHSLAPGDDSRGRWVGFDIDAHSADDNPALNRRYAEHLHAKLARLGFHPLACTWGTGGFHVWVFFDRDVPGLELHAFGQWCVADATTAAWGFKKPVEANPKTPRVEAGKFGTGLRVPGRHKSRNRLAAVFNGKEWETDHWAVSLILSRTGDAPALIPAEACPVAEAPASKPPSESAPPAPGEDVFASYNRSVTLNDVVGWHVAHDHKVHHREPGRVEFTRGGKEGGQSFNVKLVDGVPVTYSFSNAAGMPPNRGLNPSQMRCVYELGACDKVTMNRFSDTLRSELGWRARGKAGPRVVINGQAAPAGADPLAGDIYRTTDMANAKRFAADHAGRALFVKDWNCWYVWDGRRWVEDKGGTSSLALAKETVRRMTEQAAEAGAEAFRRRGSAVGEAAVAAAEKDQKAAEDALKWAKKSQDARLLAGMLKLARTDLAIDKGSAQFDAARYLLNCPNGTVNLRTGELRPHDPTDYITKLCPTNYDPTAAAPRYRKFLAQILPDAAVADYVREVGGYAATGEVSDQSVHFFVGDGSNGKSVLLKLWAEVLGEYAAAAPPEVIADRGESRHPTEKMILRGARLVVCHESAEGDTLNEQRVKALTGSDAITARGMKENFSTFSPTHTLILATNVLPTVTGDDHAIWRRVRLVRFDVRFWTEADRKLYPDRDYPDDLQADAMLGERLHQEAEGVLADLVANAAEFYGNEQRLRPPAAVSALVKEYREGEDHMGRFFRGWQADINAAVSARTFYELFAAWFKREVDNAAHRCPTNRAFGLRAARVFGKPHETNRGRFYGASERAAAA